MIELNRQEAEKFLAKHNLTNCQIIKVAGDASFRSYYRIISDSKTFILMFAPPSHEDIKPFIKVDEFLVKNGFSAPQIFAIDYENGFILLEDLSDDTYGRVLANDSSNEIKIYKKACDVLLKLHQVEILKDLPVYNSGLLFREVMLLIDWYLPLQKKSITLEEKKEYKAAWFDLFDKLNKENQVVVLRDYHADNLMILPDRENEKQVGLLDFQDAVIGSKAYDLVSLLEDARRDIAEKKRQEIFQYYLNNFSCDKEKFETDYAILSLQRNIKILGIFARLSMRDNKHNYLALMPRVLGYVEQRLNSQNPIFSEISKVIKKLLKNTDNQIDEKDFKKLETPSSDPKNPSAEVLENLQLISDVFQQIEQETSEIAEMIFDYLIEASDENLINGTIPNHPNNKINSYIKILNRLFKFSRDTGRFRIINRKTIEDLDKKTFTICMCHDGGVSLDILCDIVNTENQARIPTKSPVKVTVTKAFGNSIDNQQVR